MPIYSECYKIARMQPMNNTEERISEYTIALMECRTNPAYFAQTPIGELPATCEPLMSWDSRGWTTITKRVVKVFDSQRNGHVITRFL
jgi:hypothetical protein